MSEGAAARESARPPLKRNVRVVAEGVGGAAAHVLRLATIVFAVREAPAFVGVGKIAPGLRHASSHHVTHWADLFMTKRATTDLL